MRRDLPLLGALALSGPAVAADEAPTELAEASDDDGPGRWGGLLIPLIGANPIDGFGFGFGGELFRRPLPPSQAVYDLKLTPSFYVNTRFDYTNDMVRLEWNHTVRWLAVVGFQAWANMSYGGSGGADILRKDRTEIGNRLLSPYAYISATRGVGDSPWSVFGAVYVRGASVGPDEGGLLDVERPFGSGGGVYTDLSVGAERRQVDHWPLPTRGHLLQGSARGGLTAADGTIEPLSGVQLEGMGWLPLVPERLTLGGRLLIEKSAGERPFFEQDKVAGRWRDELGSEQALAGYGRTRTRGDGVIAGLVEIRPRLLNVQPGGVDIKWFLSGTAELGWLYRKADPGPPLPTLGVGTILLWQDAVQLRPFVAWGWRADGEDATRTPTLQFAISVMDAL